MVWLWPKGNFTFSPTKGFEGEAESIVVKGKQAHQKTLNITNELKQDSTIIKTNYQHLKQKSRENQTQFWPQLGMVSTRSHFIFRLFGI